MAAQDAYEHDPVSHAVAHHLVAIAELKDEYGYARVSDVARRLGITRGSASITLKGLKQRGLVTMDERRFLDLSADGWDIAESIQAKKAVMKELFVRVLGVDPEQAEQDTCQLEHLVSAPTAERAERLLRFLDSGNGVVPEFLEAFARFGGAEKKAPPEKRATKKSRPARKRPKGRKPRSKGE
jgi:Mn-dependent DtxR family transcriptional regulator